MATNDYWCSVSVSECGRYAVLYEWDFVHANSVYLLRLAEATSCCRLHKRCGR